MGFVVRVLINGVAIWVATLILPGLQVLGGQTTAGRIGVILLVALLFGIVNAVVKPIVALLSLPLYILTLGLFTLVVNGLMLLLTEWITERTDWGLRIDDFGTAVLGALIVSVVSFVLSAVTNRD
ncbi:phage holin family protein [Cellulomonas shaoxiangyii]|uniref:Phage holin family protein n=1 Tax=Cellulomonas shaoxiangyii TaxID=2566013 RepID=A0A4P7SQ75_9CELL|nr:phage holin family protein [Cellulomonas shaoxiangyii]QCB94913.1 phage holin family protein [Cellulomonas shaoxiangyii]TGY77256.1 phage holin family protein [Cellulomonas shaoxiangyii]